MPRVLIKKKDYKLKDFKGWIVAQMKLNGLRQKDVAEALGITQGVLCLRLRVSGEKGKFNPDPFSYGDLLTLFELFDTPPEERQRLLTM